VKNDEIPQDPVNELICSKCLLYRNCSASCEIKDEVYSRIGRRFVNSNIIYTPPHRLTKDMRHIIRTRITDIIREYLQEQE